MEYGPSEKAEIGSKQRTTFSRFTVRASVLVHTLSANESRTTKNAPCCGWLVAGWLTKTVT